MLDVECSPVHGKGGRENQEMARSFACPIGRYVFCGNTLFTRSLCYDGLRRHKRRNFMLDKDFSPA
jgi:hypothetical protein